ncbi:MAG: ketosteroid isomerase family protein [Cyanobacteria bacterium P01_D01_bin.156]
MSTTHLIEQQLIDAIGLSNESEVVLRYFTLFNQGRYEQVSRLFSSDGRLYPPFESPIVGPENIESYLVKEADGMTVSLLSAEIQLEEDEHLQIDVRGKVTALVFKVNVTWRFIVTSDNKIESVRVNLVATLEELLKLRPEEDAQATVECSHA